MTKRGIELLTKVGIKGQIVLRKEVRKSLGIKPGSLVRQKIEGKKLILQPFDVEEEMKKMDGIARMVGKKVPKGMSSVDIIRKERE